jgi:nucleotide-binding universal stress UspA family protein
LKIHTIVEENSINSTLDNTLQGDKSCVILVNKEVDDHIFSSHTDILSTVNNIGANSLFVPPGYAFKKLKDIVLVTDFTSRDFKKYIHVSNILKPFNPLINAVDVASKKQYFEMDMKSKSWIKTAETMFSGLQVKTNILIGNSYNKALIDYINNTQPDLVILFRKKNKKLIELLRKNTSRAIIRSCKVPVLYSGIDG